jgi:hypothetical protein
MSSSMQHIATCFSRGSLLKFRRIGLASPVKVSRRFGGSHRYLNAKVCQARNQQEAVIELYDLYACFILACP